jgi:hypothetical protein
MFYYIFNFAFEELKNGTKLSVTKFGHLKDLEDN